MIGQTSQAATALMMVSPVKFCYNPEAALDNAFMTDLKSSQEATQTKARQEFDNYVSILKSKGIEVASFEDTLEPHKPDSIFPNNWISFHEDGTIILYPMKPTNRRIERREDIIEGLQSKFNFKVSDRFDVTKEEEANRFLEGTGSIVFDYQNKIAYACISQRTSKEVLEKVVNKIGYKAHTFTSVDENGKEIYHTNVMMCVAEKFALVCAQSVKDEVERENLLNSLRETGHEVILLSYEQILKYAGNSLEVCNQKGERFLIISKCGYESLTEEQKKVIEQYDEIVPVPLETIETIGGGSARCMIADIRLPKA